MNNRQKEIMIDLLEQSDFVSAAYLAELHQVSTKTIYMDLPAIEEALHQKKLVLKKVPRHGVYIDGDSLAKEQLVLEIRSQFKQNLNMGDYAQREPLYLKKLLLDQDGCSILDFSVDFYISETSVRRDLEKLENLLLENQLVLTKDHGQIFISGDEQEIRHFLRSYLVETYKLLSNSKQLFEQLSQFFPAKNLICLMDKIRNLAGLFAISIPNHLEIYLLLDLMINSHRIRKNHYLTKIDTGMEEDLRHLEVYPFASELLSNSLGLPIDLLKDVEIKEICFTILSLGYVNIKNENSDFKLLTNHLIEKVSELSGIDFSQDHYLRDMINNHMRPMIYRLKNGMKIENQTTEEIKKRYSILFNIVWLASKIVSDKYHIDFLDSEIAFLTIYFQIAVEKIEKPLLIYIICPHGLATSELIVNSLKRIISSYDHIKKIDFAGVTDEVIKEADIVISSVELQQLTKPYILVSPVLSQFEMDKIQEVYHSLSDGNRKTLSVINDQQSVNQSMISELVQNRIYLDESFDSYEEVIQFLVNQEKSQYDDSTAYLDSIIQRESLGSTSVYTGIALPHANPRTVKKSQLSLLTLRKPIMWGMNKVKVIMLISIKEGEEEFYKDALIYLYSKIDNQNFIDRLAEAKSRESFLRILFGKE